jgi:excisionase family DNA binding protein
LGHPLFNVVGIKSKYWYPVAREFYAVDTPKKHSISSSMKRKGLMQDEEMLTVDQAARFLQVNERTVRGYIASGELPVMPIGKRGYRIAKSDLLAFIEKRKRRLKDGEDQKD